MPLREALAWLAGSVVEIARVVLGGFPEEHIRCAECGAFERPPARACVPVETSAAIDHGAIHQIAGKFYVALFPGERVRAMERAHVHLPTLHGGIEKPVLRTVVGSCLGKRFARFVKPAGGQRRIHRATRTAASRRRDPRVILSPATPGR